MASLCSVRQLALLREYAIGRVVLLVNHGADQISDLLRGERQLRPLNRICR